MLRLWLTNTANTRVFNVRLPGARMKLVGGDSGRVEHEEFVSEVLLAPSERAVVDVLFDQPGQLTLEHRTPDRTYPLASITVTEEPAEPSLADSSERCARAPSWSPSASSSTRWLAAPPDKILALVAEMDDPTAPGRGRTDGLRLPDAPGGHQRPAGPLPEVRHEAARHGAPCRDDYACPMHPEVVQRPARALPQVRHEAARRAAPAAGRPRSMDRARHGPRGRHAPRPR